MITSSKGQKHTKIPTARFSQKKSSDILQKDQLIKRDSRVMISVPSWNVSVAVWPGHGSSCGGNHAWPARPAARRIARSGATTTHTNCPKRCLSQNVWRKKRINAYTWIPSVITVNIMVNLAELIVPCQRLRVGRPFIAEFNFG